MDDMYYEVQADLAKISETAKKVLHKEDRPEMISMDGGMMDKACVLVWEKFYQGQEEVSPTFSVQDVYVVWFSKTLRNWKALLSTNVKDDMYYEVTYNGNGRETYIDQYHKVKNVCITDESLLPRKPSNPGRDFPIGA